MATIAQLLRPAVRTTLATGVALACAAVPVFLLGALSELVRADLGFDEAGIGAGVAVFFVAAALSAYPAGRVTERLGGRVAMLAGTVAASLAGVAIGLVAGQWWHVAGLLAVAGAAVGLIDTGGAKAFADVVPARRHGLAFGLKEASVPAASMLAGVAVPLVGVTLGWRPAFAIGMLLVPVVWLLLPPAARDPSPDRAPAAGNPPAVSVPVRVAIGSAAGTGAATAGASFLVPSAVRAGLSLGVAGMLLAVASVLSILMRVIAGLLADRIPHRELLVTAGLLVAGAVGALLLGVGTVPLTVVGGLLVLGGGWGWTGLVFLSAVRTSPHAPASAAGIVLAGLAAGGAIGPLAFGLLASGVGYPTAWLATTLALTAGAVVIWAAHRRFDAPPPGSPRRNARPAE